MEDLIASAEKKVLVEVVKLAQKRGMQGNKGSWKEFLKSYDRKFGSSLSDPAKRSIDVLSAFLKTFDKIEDVKILAKVVPCISNRLLVKEATAKFPENESSEQRLLRLTLDHPLYPLEYSFSSYDEDWVVTNLSKNSKAMESDKIIAVDCEMVLCEDGSEAVVRVCAVDRNLQVKLDKLVNPNKAVADYRTKITGICASDLDGVTCILADVQKSMSKLLSHGAILVGHSLSNDLRALKIDHPRVIDTSFVYKYSVGPANRRPSLNNLCKSVLGYEVRKKDAPHNCLDDACAAMKLVLAKIEHQVDTISVIEEDVSNIEMEKLLLHKIPCSVPSEDLHEVMPGDFTIEVQPSWKAQADKYSAFATFKNSEDANQAYDILKALEEKDSYGRPQKHVEIQFVTGIVADLYVRKMAPDDYSLGQVSLKKRASSAEETLGEVKKLKTNKNTEAETVINSNQCCDHVKEIERLKQELKNKDFEISKLNKMVSKCRKDKKKRR